MDRGSGKQRGVLISFSVVSSQFVCVYLCLLCGFHPHPLHFKCSPYIIASANSYVWAKLCLWQISRLCQGDLFVLRQLSPHWWKCEDLLVKASIVLFSQNSSFVYMCRCNTSDAFITGPIFKENILLKQNEFFTN